MLISPVMKYKTQNIKCISNSTITTFIICVEPPLRHSFLFIASRSDLLSAHLGPAAASQSEVGTQIFIDFFRLIAINRNKEKKINKQK